MTRTRYGTPYWLDRVPAGRRPAYPRHRGEIEIDVAIAGGGITGCTIAWLFAAAGVRVALFEAGRIGAGSTASSAGLLLHEPDADFQQVAGAYGLRAARRIWQTSRRASLDFAAALRRLDVRCDLSARDVLRVPATRAAEAALRKDARARREAGLEAGWLTAAALRRETSLAAPGAVRSKGNGELDPYRACLGLAAAATARGAAVFERSPVLRVRGARRGVEIRTAAGRARASTLVIATTLPPADFKPLQRHFRPAHTYAVATGPLPAAVRREVGRRQAALRDTAAPPHWLRWIRDDRVLFGGADQPRLPERARARALVQRTGQLMYELSTLYPGISGLQPEYGWDAPIARTVDGLPCLGPHRNYPRHLFALGLGHSGPGLSYLGARILLRHYQGDPAKEDELFAFSRLPR